MHTLRFSLIILLSISGYCSQAQRKIRNRDTICLVQINDIYEISPLQNGRVGGIARIAQFIDDCEKRYPTHVFVAGDFLSPSVMGTATVSGERLSGRQMIDGLNAIGVDYVTFGNHEFDIGEAALQKRINESRFTWFSGNVFRSDGSVFERQADGNVDPFPASVKIRSPRNRFGIRLFAVTLPSNTPAYTRFTSYDSALQAFLQQRPRRRMVDMGLTHLSAAEDQELLRKYPRIRLIMGGHEHEHMYIAAGAGHVAKADANGKTVYRHLIWKDKGKGISIRSELVRMDESIPQKTEIVKRVSNWERAVYDAFRKQGLEPERKVCTITDTLRGTEASIRYGQNNLGAMITGSLDMKDEADAAFINSGAIRIDDDVTGGITELDVIRIMPFGNKIVEVTMKGALLEKILMANDGRKGLGGYLQLDGRIRMTAGKIYIGDRLLEANRDYRIRTVEFLLSGKELKLEYLTDKNPEISSVKPVNDESGKPLDLRLAFIRRLKERYGG